MICSSAFNGKFVWITIKCSLDESQHQRKIDYSLEYSRPECKSSVTNPMNLKPCVCFTNTISNSSSSSTPIPFHRRSSPISAVINNGQLKTTSTGVLANRRTAEKSSDQGPEVLNESSSSRVVQENANSSTTVPKTTNQIRIDDRSITVQTDLTVDRGEKRRASMAFDQVQLETCNTELSSEDQKQIYDFSPTDTL